MEDLEDGAEADETTPEDEKEKNKDRFVPTEQRSAVDSNRRSDSEEARQQSDEEFEGEEKRQEPDRRSPSDRREIACEITCKTSGSLTVIEDWMDDHCEGEWNLVLDALDEGLAQKSIRAMFELASDREKFIQVYGKGGE